MYLFYSKVVCEISHTFGAQHANIRPQSSGPIITRVIATAYQFHRRLQMMTLHCSLKYMHCIYQPQHCEQCWPASVKMANFSVSVFSWRRFLLEAFFSSIIFIVNQCNFYLIFILIIDIFSRFLWYRSNIFEKSIGKYSSIYKTLYSMQVKAYFGICWIICLIKFRTMGGKEDMSNVIQAWPSLLKPYAANPHSCIYNFMIG